MEVLESRQQPNRFARRLFAPLPARYDRLAPCRNIENLSETWDARLVLHSAGHFHLANSPRIFPELAREICLLGGV